MVLVVKNLPVNAGDIKDSASIPGLGRSLGGGNGNPLQYSCLENPVDRGAWWGYSPWGRTLPPECAQRILAGVWSLTQDLCPSGCTLEAHLPVCGTGSRLSSNFMPPRPHWGVNPIPTRAWTDLSDHYLCVGFLHPTFQPLWLHRHDLPPGP